MGDVIDIGESALRYAAAGSIFRLRAWARRVPDTALHSMADDGASHDPTQRPSKQQTYPCQTHQSTRCADDHPTQCRRHRYWQRRRNATTIRRRESDVLDCPWLQQLIAYSLLSGTFRPAQEVCVLRTVWHQREMLPKSQARLCSTCRRRTRR